MPGVHCGQRLLSARELLPWPYRFTGHASSKPYEVIVLWRSCRGRLYRLYAPDDTEYLRSGERSHVGELADPSIACVDGGRVLEQTLAALAFVARSLRGCPTNVEANPNSSIGSHDGNGSQLDISAEAQRKAGRRIEFPFKNCRSHTRSWCERRRSTKC
jgi:hypothetical protein